MYCTSVLFQCIRLQNLHTQKKGIICWGRGGGGACLVCFVNQLFINLGIPWSGLFSPQTVQQCWCLLTSFIPDITMPFLIKTYWKVDAVYCTNFLICVPSSFVGKIYTNHRSKHFPGVRFYKYLLAHLLTSLFQLFRLYFLSFARFDNFI